LAVLISCYSEISEDVIPLLSWPLLVLLRHQTFT
jgi:hypothetical protein